MYTWARPKPHTHTECGLFPPQCHISYRWGYYVAPLYIDVFSTFFVQFLCRIREQPTSHHLTRFTSQRPHLTSNLPSPKIRWSPAVNILSSKVFCFPATQTKPPISTLLFVYLSSRPCFKKVIKQISNTLRCCKKLLFLNDNAQKFFNTRAKKP